MATPPADVIDKAGFSTWKFRSDFDVNGALQAIVVGLPVDLAAGNKKFFAQIGGDGSTGAFRWSARSWYASYANAEAYVIQQFKIEAKARLGL